MDATLKLEVDLISDHIWSQTRPTLLDNKGKPTYLPVQYYREPPSPTGIGGKVFDVRRLENEIDRVSTQVLNHLNYMADAYRLLQQLDRVNPSEFKGQRLEVLVGALNRIDPERRLHALQVWMDEAHSA